MGIPRAPNERDAEERHELCSRAKAITICVTSRCRRPISSSTAAAGPSPRSGTIGPAVTSGDRSSSPASTTAVTGRSSSAQSSGCTTNSPNLVRAPSRPRRCAMAISPRCWRRASPSTIRSPHAQEGEPRRAVTVSRQHHSAGADQSHRAGGAELLSRAESGGRLAGPRQLLLDQPAHGRLLFASRLRVDHRLTDKQQAFVRYTRNDRTESRNAILRRG